MEGRGLTLVIDAHFVGLVLGSVGEARAHLVVAELRGMLHYEHFVGRLTRTAPSTVGS